MAKTPEYEAEIRPNERGGFEIAEPGAPKGMGIGNYPTPEAAYAVAKYNFERVKPCDESAPAPVKPKKTLKLRQIFSAAERTA